MAIFERPHLVTFTRSRSKLVSYKFKLNFFPAVCKALFLES